jgi:hypothetical protein
VRARLRIGVHVEMKGKIPCLATCRYRANSEQSYGWDGGTRPGETLVEDARLRWWL